MNQPPPTGVFLYPPAFARFIDGKYYTAAGFHRFW